MQQGKHIRHMSHTLKRQAAFCNKIDEYYNDGIYTDVNIICENRAFKCHRLALAATSEYFHRMFCGNFAESHAQDVVLHDFDSITFEQVLLYVYRGEIATIDDDNVFNLLRASDILQLSDLEDHCVHYLSQKNIPMDCALEIYLFATALHKIHLIHVISPFVLQNLDRFSQESKFLEISFENFSSLLTYFQPSSSSQDMKLLNGIRRWVCHSTHIRHNTKLYFIELAKRVQFESVSAEQVAEYFDRNLVDSNNECRRSEVSATLDMGPIVKMNESSLRVYVKTAGKGSELINDEDYDEDYKDYWIASQTRIFSLQAENVGKASIGWHYSHKISPTIETMRIVESDGRLYDLEFYNDEWRFNSSPTFKLSGDLQPLTLPLAILTSKIADRPAWTTSLNLSLSDGVNDDTFFRTGYFSLCSLQGKIYLNGLSPDVDFQCYDTELDMWSTIPIVSQYKRKNLLNDDARLYMIEKDSCSDDGTPLFAAYDPRAGNVEKLNDEGLCRITCFQQPGHYHKGRIYLPDDYINDATFKIPIYDTVAGRWDLQNLKCAFATNTNYHRFVSSENRLYMLGLFKNDLYTYSYDSYLQEWNRIYLDELCDASTKSDVNFIHINDVIAY